MSRMIPIIDTCTCVLGIAIQLSESNCADIFDMVQEHSRNSSKPSEKDQHLGKIVETFEKSSAVIGRSVRRFHASA